MDKENDNSLPLAWAVGKLDEIRRQLAEGNWPAGGDELLADLLRQGDPRAADELSEMLSVVVDDALQGIDVSQRYREFYGLLTRHEALHRAFIESLEILSESVDPDWDPLPQPPDEDVSFLHAALLGPLVTQVEPDHGMCC